MEISRNNNIVSLNKKFVERMQMDLGFDWSFLRTYFWLDFSDLIF